MLKFRQKVMFLPIHTISKLCCLPNIKFGFYLNSLGCNTVYWGLYSDFRLKRCKWVCTFGTVEILGI